MKYSKIFGQARYFFNRAAPLSKRIVPVAAFGLMAYKYNIQKIQVEAWGASKTEKKRDPYLRSKKKEPILNADQVVIVSGTSNPELSQSVASYLSKPLCNIDLKRFADGETSIHIKDQVKGKHVYIVQSTSKPVNDNVMELFLLVSACKRGGAQSVTCAIPYYGYARQERKHHNWTVPISASDVAQILEFLGVDRILTLDLHANAVTGSVSSKTVFEDYEAAFTGIDHFMKVI